jgi:hypothetical protein
MSAKVEVTFSTMVWESDQIKIMQSLQITGKKIDKFNGNGDHEDPVLSDRSADTYPACRSFLTDRAYLKLYISMYNSLLERLNEPS